MIDSVKSFFKINKNSTGETFYLLTSVYFCGVSSERLNVALGCGVQEHISIYELILIENAVSRCAPKSRVTTNDKLIRNRGQVQIQFIFKEI